LFSCTTTYTRSSSCNIKGFVNLIYLDSIASKTKRQEINKPKQKQKWKHKQEQTIYMMYCVIWYDMIWLWCDNDMMWYDIIWYDMIWYDMIW
jgi:hypothetical protein